MASQSFIAIRGRVEVDTERRGDDQVSNLCGTGYGEGSNVVQSVVFRLSIEVVRVADTENA